MSVEKVKEFFKRLEDDEVFRDDFLKDETLEKGNTETIFRAAAALGYEFSADDLKAAKEEMKDIELTNDQLEKVSGGFGFAFCVGYGYGYWTVVDNDNTASGSGGAVAFCLGFGFN
ncbi:MAG: Nif11-like leader peptide family RiPP precursor [Deferribacterales bacterium]